MRGNATMPKPGPAHGCTTRIQHEPFSSAVPIRSQRNFTLTRPYSSVWMSSPFFPTTTAVCKPCTKGRSVSRCETKRVFFGIASKRHLNIGPAS